MSDEFKKVQFTQEEPAASAEEHHQVVSEPAKPMPMTSTSSSKNTKKAFTSILLAVVIVFLGTASGYALSKATGGSDTTSTSDSNALPSEDGAIELGKLYGSDDESIFPDTGEGVLLKGGIEGEGSHRILRPGGPTQTIYLTSSVMDLDPYINHKVQVWGETFAAQRASWLMDVGGIKVLEMNADKPFEEEPSEEPEFEPGEAETEEAE